jgi:4,5-dihydroxyphthalate decarboxylase
VRLPGGLAHGWGATMPRLAITLACGDYDRTRALADGRVQVEGVDLTVLALSPEETFFRMVRFEEFDVAELSLSTYVLTLGQDAPFVAVPVFPSRAFRHNGIYVHSAAGIEEPEHLVGRRVGVAEYQLTANVWIRGILADFHDVPVNSVRYVTGGLHQPGREEKVAIPALPEGVEVVACPEGRTLSEMLVRGEIDALYTPRAPRPFLDRDPRVRRLFPNVREVEERYFQQTQIFPIMHVVAIRREVYRRSRWLASSLAKAFGQARDLAFRGLDETASLPIVLPWVYDEIGRVQAMMGDDYWSYGLNDANERALGTFIRYAREQGLAKDDIEPRDLFAPETLDSLTI